MPTLIRSQADVQAASMEDLVYTHNALRGESVETFDSLDAARVRVRLDILASENVVAQRGLAPGQRPVAKTIAELGDNPYKPGTMSHELHAAIQAQTPIERRPRQSEQPPEKREARKVVHAVRATFAGVSRVQPTSVRGAVLKAAQDAPNATITIADLERQLNQPVRGYIQKLMELNHLVAIDPPAESKGEGE